MWSGLLLDDSEVVTDSLLYMGLVFEDFHVTVVTDTFDLGHDRVASLDPHDVVSQGVELLHLALPQQG